MGTISKALEKLKHSFGIEQIVVDSLFNGTISGPDNENQTDNAIEIIYKNCNLVVEIDLKPLSNNVESLMFIILGLGLVVEGQILMWKTMAKDGINTNELAHIVTGVIGILSVAFLAGIAWVIVITVKDSKKTNKQMKS